MRFELTQMFHGGGARLRGGGTDPKGLTVARGGFDDHAADGVYLCAGCHAPLYSSDSKWDCGCGWPGFWTCKKDALYEKRDGARGEIRCTACDVSVEATCIAWATERLFGGRATRAA
jgi:hypothetical protein